MALETRTFTRTELKEFLKDDGKCRFSDKDSLCVYDGSFDYPYRFYYNTKCDSAAMDGIWKFADGIQEWHILKRPRLLEINLSDLYPKRIHFKL